MFKKTSLFLLSGILGVFFLLSPLQGQEKDPKDEIKKLKALKAKLQQENRELKMKLRTLTYLLRSYQRKLQQPGNNWQEILRRLNQIAQSFQRELRRAGPKKALKKLLRQLFQKKSSPPRPARPETNQPLRATPNTTPETQARIFYTKGIIALNKKDYKEAIGHFTKAIELNAGEAYYYLARANAYLFIKDYEHSKRDYLKTITLNPNLSTAYYNLACIYALQNNKEKALDWLQKSIKKGFKDLEHMKKDPDLNSLHGDKRFKELFNKKWK